MSDSTPAFTGRRRERNTKKSVLIVDRVAKALISVGGIGTILAVLGVCVFLVSVAVPLFLPADIDPVEDFPLTENEIAHLAVDEYRLLSWILRPSGQVEVYRLDTGALRDEMQIFADGEMVSSSFLIRGDLAVFGLVDGRVRMAQVGFETSIVDAEALPPQVVEALERNPETPADHQNGVVAKTPQGQYQIQSLKVKLGREARIADGPVRKISHVIGPNGPLIAALAQDRGTLSGTKAFGPKPEDATQVTAEVTVAEPASDADSPDLAEPTTRLFLIAGIERSNFLTGETSLELEDPVEVPFESTAAPSHLRLAGAGDSLYLAWPNGALERYDCSQLDATFLAEKGNLVADGLELTFLEFILGNNTLVWGDSAGTVQAGFPIRTEDLAEEMGLRNAQRNPQAGKSLVPTKDLNKGEGVAALSMASSSRTRQLIVGFEDGHISMYNATSATRLAEDSVPSEEAILRVVMAPKEDGLVAATSTRLYSMDLDPRHPEASLSALFQPVWYEGYPRAEHTWQSSSGTDDFEVKLGLIPLIFGTIKATIYSMMFGVPLALLAALFTSEFLHPRAKAYIKPGIELMASLPSVVLGFLAALVFAPYIEKVVPATLASFFTIPFAFLLGAFLWQLLPVHLAVRLANWRFLFMLAVAPLGLLLAGAVGPLVERLFFAGDLKGWLAWDSGEEGAERFASGAGGWLLVVVPLSGMLVALLISHYVHPWMRAAGVGWDRRRFALMDLAKFAFGIVGTLALALSIAYLLQSLGLDPRGGYLDTYVQRNALIVGFAMGFAIIPIIYTISEDALSTVPEHLRSASLGTGATPWQTATRIVIPTAMSGLFSAMMVGLGRAVGETMIVLMAAGNTPVLEWNIFEGFRTLSANIAVELPEAVRNSTHYRTLFLAALVLFVMTFVVNTLAEVIRQRFRKRAYQL